MSLNLMVRVWEMVYGFVLDMKWFLGFDWCLVQPESEYSKNDLLVLIPCCPESVTLFIS